MLGRAAIAMWWNIAPRMKREFEDWHTGEHMPERLAIPGFLRGTRWIARSGKPSYFILYEVARFDVLIAGPYLDHLNNPTPWSRRMMSHHLKMVRSLCRVRAGAGAGVPLALATLRFSAAAGKAKRLAEWLAREAIPGLHGRKGLSGAHLLASASMTGRPQTTEQKIRGADGVADWILLIGGYDAPAVEDAARALAPRKLAGHGATAIEHAGLYTPAYSLTGR